MKKSVIISVLVVVLFVGLYFQLSNYLLFFLEDFSSIILGPQVAFVKLTGLVSEIQVSVPGDIDSCQTIDTAGVYTLNQSINSSGTCFNINASNVELDCAAFNITYGETSSGNGVNVSSSSALTNVTVKNCEIIKGSSIGSDNYGIMLFDTSLSVIENNTISTDGTSANDGIFLSGSSNNNIISGVTISTNGTSSNDGISFSSSNSNTISDVTISTNGTSSNNGISLSSSSNNNITSTNISTSGSQGSNHGIFISSSSNNTISDATISTDGAETNLGIFINSASSNNNITSTTISTSGSQDSNHGIQLSSSSNSNTISGVTISTNGTNTNRGIFILSSSNNNITSTNISASGTGSDNQGIRIQSSSSNTISSTTISTSGTSGNDGIFLIASSNNNITSANISTSGSSSDNDGISLETSSNSNSISDVTISTDGTSDNDGISLSSSSNNNFSGNGITTDTSTSHGIFISSSTNNTFDSYKVNATHPTSDDWRVEGTSSSNNVAVNLTLLRNAVVIDFIADEGSAIKAVTVDEATGLGNATGQLPLNKFLNLTNTTAGASLFLNVSYTAAEAAGIAENTLRIWKHNGTDWINETFFSAGQYGVDTAANKVFANITNFSTFGVFGKTPIVGNVSGFDTTTETVASGTKVTISGNINVTFTIPGGESVDLSSTSITATTEKTVITGLSLPAGATKDVEVLGVSSGSELCIVDQSGSVNIEVGCTNGVTISCPGSIAQYNCSVSGSTATVFGLSNTVIGTFTPTPEAEAAASSGGGVGGGNYMLSERQLEQGFRKVLSVGQGYEFSIAGERHTVIVTSVVGGVATIEISSNPSSVSLSVGEEAKVDVDEDGFYDILLRFEGEVGGKADIMVMSTSGIVDRAIPTVSPEPGVPEEEREDVSTGFVSSIVFALIIAVIAVLIIIWIVRAVAARGARVGVVVKKAVSVGKKVKTPKRIAPKRRGKSVAEIRDEVDRAEKKLAKMLASRKKKKKK